MTVYLTPQTNRHFINYKGKTIELIRGDDNLWRNSEGEIFAYAELSESDDHETRCGVGFFSLPAEHPLSAACSPHDYKYSSPAYQMYHTRSEAEADLERDIKILGKGKWYSKLATPFKYLAHWFGSKYWENKNTANK